jgi:hypothetical protein
MLLKRIDPYFQDVPWEIVRDDQGKVIGEIYVLHAIKHKGMKRNDSVRGVRRTSRSRKTEVQHKRRFR